MFAMLDEGGEEGVDSNAIFFVRDFPPDGRVKVTIQETSTEIQPVYDGYPSRQHGSLSRSEVQRSYTNGHTASNATKELDDLMASLSEFKVRVTPRKFVSCLYVVSLDSRDASTIRERQSPTTWGQLHNLQRYRVR